ncbi:hypothetical protein, partial [Delftia tsuruhatensis]|uniref:hypothetical protein n=1 Tax=Delftia tsuruhatensis TaxID=180282 RepID=UPI001C3F2103
GKGGRAQPDRNSQFLSRHFRPGCEGGNGLSVERGMHFFDPAKGAELDKGLGMGMACASMQV